MIQIIATCTGPVKTITTIVKAIITLLQIIAPILLIISLIKSFTQLVINPDDKKNKGGKAILNAAIATIIVFFIPTIAFVFLSTTGTENYSNTPCWTNANSTTIAALRQQEKKEEEAIDAAKEKENKRSKTAREEVEKTREKARKENQKKAEEERKKQEEEARKREQQGGGGSSSSSASSSGSMCNENGIDGTVKVENGVFLRSSAGNRGSKGSAPEGYHIIFYERMQKFVQAAKEAGHTVNIGTGGAAYRSYEQQEYFWNCYVTQSCNNGNLAARPGTGNHEYGIASDLSFGSTADLYWAHDNAAKFCLKFPLCNNVRTGDCVENWHLEPDNIVR